MRLSPIVLAAVLSHACVHAAALGTSNGDRVAACNTDNCPGGGGSAGPAMTYTLAGAAGSLVGLAMVQLFRR